MINFMKKTFEGFVEIGLAVVLFSVAIIVFGTVLGGLYRVAAFIGGF